MNRNRALFFSKYIAVGLISIFSFFGCWNDNVLEDPDLRSVQINGVKLSSKKLPLLAGTFFSIDHAQNKIYNALPLPRNTQLDSVALNLTVSERAHVVVKIAGKEVPHNIKDSIYMRDFAKGIEIEVTNPDYEGKKKVYQLIINVYDHEPLGAEWTALSGAPVNNAHKTGVRTRLAKHAQGFYYLYGTTSESSLYFASKDTPSSWQLSAQIAESIVDIDAYDADHLIALKASGDLVKVKGAQTTAIPLGYKAKALLGSYQRNYEAHPSVALVVEKEGALFFAEWTGDKLTLGERCPEAFPIEGFMRLHRKLENQSILTLFAGLQANHLPQNRIWTTSTSLDWLSPSPAQPSNLPLTKGMGAVAYDPADGVVLFWAVGNEQSETGKIEVYTSKDHGQTWEKSNREDLLPAPLKTTIIGRGLASYVDSKHKVYLFGGASSNTPSVHCGNPFRFR